jgi:hypothetical protein
MNPWLQAALFAAVLLGLFGCQSAADDDRDGGASGDDDDGSPATDDDDDASPDDDNDATADDDDDNDTNRFCNSPDSPDAWRQTVLVSGGTTVQFAKILIVEDDHVVVIYGADATTLVRAEQLGDEWQCASIDFGAGLPASNGVDVIAESASEYDLAVCAYGGDLYFTRWGSQPLDKELLAAGCQLAGLAVDSASVVHLASNFGDSTWTYWRGGPSDWATETVLGSQCIGHVFAVDGEIFVGGYDREESDSPLLHHRGDAGWDSEKIRQTPLGARVYGTAVFVTPEKGKYAAYSFLWDYGPPPEHSGLLVAKMVGDAWQEFVVDPDGWYPMLAVDGDGVAHVLYDGTSHGGFGVRYAFVTREGESHVYKVCEEPNCSSEAIALDSKGCVHLVYYKLGSMELIYQTNRKAN